MKRYNQLMMSIAQRVKEQFGAAKVSVWQETEKSGKYVEI